MIISPTTRAGYPPCLRRYPACCACPATLEEAQGFAENLLEAEMKLGELLAAIEPDYEPPIVGSPKGTYDHTPKKKPSLPKGVSKKVSHQAQTLSAHRDIVEQISARARERQVKGSCPHATPLSPRDAYKANRAVMVETVDVARNWLREQMKGSWEDVSKSIHDLFESKHAFQQSRNQGVGWQTIKKFLGGDWKEWEVQEALAQLAEKCPPPYPASIKLEPSFG